ARARAEAWVLRHQPRGAAGAFNEALMELGATVCAPSSPRCGACPLRAGCRAHALGRMQDFPVKARKKAPRRVRVALALARRGETILLERREDGLLAGTWGLPWIEVGDGEDAAAALARRVAAIVGAPAAVADAPVARGTHVFTHRRWEMEAYEVRTDGAGGAWRRPDEVALGTAHRKMLAPGR
ncbi:MAG TPA: NUDIX domain-containing protein, partial [Candidatus Thermoplasmatota archaeon]|nr:NUDIX domain-containing protein [Candidatus Thermoplasmatota archaeon]